MDLTLDTAPDPAQVLALLSVGQMKKNLRISHTIEDDFIEECIREAYAWLDGRDGWLRRAILTQTWTWRIPGFVTMKYATDYQRQPTYTPVPTSILEIPIGPLQTVTSVKYYLDDVLTTLVPADYYRVHTGGLFGRIVKIDGTTWPTGLDVREDQIEIKFVAGYGTAAQVITKARGIIKGMKLLGADFFRNREDPYAEPRLVAVNRKIVNGLEKVAGRYRVFNDHA